MTANISIIRTRLNIPENDMYNRPVANLKANYEYLRFNTFGRSFKLAIVFTNNYIINIEFQYNYNMMRER